MDAEPWYNRPVPSPLPRARKSLGQHFLIDPNIRDKIIRAAELSPHDTVLEIGPGTGVLTRSLARMAGRVIAVEVDRALAARLTGDLADLPNVHVVQADALSYPLDTLPKGTTVVANLPYNIATPILFRLLELRSQIARMIVMIQKEVAHRLIARPGTKAYGTLSVAVGMAADARIIFPVSPNCFRPRPKVDSAVVQIIPLVSPRLPVKDSSTFFAVVRAGFGRRRKTVANALASLDIAKNDISEALSAAGLTPSRRAETFSLEEFARLADRVFELCGPL